MVRIKETGLTLASSAYEALRQDIIEGRVKPGEKLQFDALRQKYGIGVSPIREALSRLQSEGWVAREEQRGYRVAEVSKSELLDVVKTRVMIEGIAVAEAIARQDVAAEEALVLAFHRLSKQHRLLEGGGRNPEWEKRHRQFHMALIRGCGMQWIKQFCEQLFDVAERYRLMATANSPERRELDEHQAILQAYIGGEPETVKALLARHYQVTVDHILQSQSLPTPDRADTLV